jgi:histone acetyltransferase (RNA polymerase elongator complex component)
VLQLTRRGYDREQALEACRLVKTSGLKLSVQLMPGLPGYDSTSLADMIADTIAVQPDYVRIYPTIVIEGTPLADMYHREEYTPMSFESAIRDVCFMVNKFELAGIKVIKIGLTGIERSHAIAGPYHPSFGEIIKAEQYVQKILNKFESNMVLTISKMDVSLLLGHKKEYLTRIKHHYKQSTLKIKVSEFLKKGEFLYSESKDYVLW